MGDRRHPETTRLHGDILAALTDADRPLSTADVARSVGVSPVGTEAYRALLWLYDHGQVDRDQPAHTGTRTLYWTPTPHPRTSEENDHDQRDRVD